MVVLITVTRRTFTTRSTISTWTVTRGSETSDLCVGLEDVDRGLAHTMSREEIARRKIDERTAIPVGEYGVIITHSPRFHTTLPLLLDVRGFTGIRIHAGNTAEDTEGCLVTGLREAPDRVDESRAAMTAIRAVFASAARAGEAVRVRIEREPEAWARFCALHPDITGHVPVATTGEGGGDGG